MITVMRRYRRTLQVGLLVVIAAFVVTSVWVFGQGQPGGDAPPDAVAVVNGEPVPAERYQRAYANYTNMFAEATRRPLTPEMAERMGLPGQVLDALVNEVVIAQRARAEGLEATDRDVNAAIHAIGAFQEGGRFSMARYREVLKRNNLTEVRFEADVRRELTRKKVEDLVRGGARVSDTEIEQAFVQRREEVRAAWALVELAPLLAGVAAGDAELEAYLKDHQAEFRQPERRKVQYVVIAPRDFTRPVTDAQVEAYYKEHAAEFETPREVQVAHVLARVGETGGSEAEDKARARAADAIRRARAGEDFARVARELSEDTATAPGGGDLGFVKPGDLVPEFARALSALGRGEVSPEPVRTPFGFHAIKVLDVRGGGRRALKEVAGEIREKLAGDAADGAARARAEEVRPPLQAAGDFMAEARKLGLTPLEATVARSDRALELGGRDPIEEAAFNLAQGGISAPVKTPAGWIVLRTVESLPAGVPPLADIKEAVTAAVKRQKADAMALERARAIAAAARDGALPEAARKVGATTGEAPRFSRTKPAERLPGDAQVAALATPAGSVAEPVRTQQGYYVLKVLERIPPDLAGLAAERENLRRELTSVRQGQAWEAWLSQARAGARIELTGRAPTPRRSRG